MRDVAVSEVAGAVVTGWRVVDHVDLLLALRGQPDEVRLKCRCERGHWIVRERPAERPPTFLATCHNCGNRLELLLEAVSRPA